MNLLNGSITQKQRKVGFLSLRCADIVYNEKVNDIKSNPWNRIVALLCLEDESTTP
jgi:hypothetical protein